MNRPAKSGRPAKRRNPVAGEHLRQALKLLGKNWRKNTEDPDHVLNWDLWTALGLPRSTTTIDADIRQGVPEERLVAYAQCLGLSPTLFGTPDVDIRFELGLSRQGNVDMAPPSYLDFGSSFEQEYRNYNSPHYIQDLFKLITGVYRVSYLLTISDIIYRCAFWFNAAQQHHIIGNGLFVMFGLDNFFDVHLFRWHNNLHASYLCDNKKEFGHFILIDPLRHNLVAKRNPFWLQGHGVTDSGLTDNAPIAFVFHMEKVPLPGNLPPGAFWAQECEALRCKPSVLPDAAAYAGLREKILAPDSMPCPGTA